MHEHLTSEGLSILLEQDNNEAQNRVLFHLLAVCPDCYRECGFLLELRCAGEIGERFSTIDVEMARSQKEAPGLWEKLKGFSLAHQLGLVRDTRQFRSWGLVEFLCRESERAISRDLAQAERQAELAVTVAEVLEEWQPAEMTWLLELRALALAHLGNARRVRGDLRGAKEAFKAAERWWHGGANNAGDVLGYEPRILALKASLYRDLRRLPEALALLEEALAADVTLSFKAKLLLSKANILREIGEVDLALTLLTDAAVWIDPKADPRLYLLLRHNLLDYLTIAGRFSEASNLLPQVAALAKDVGEEIDRTRLSWIEGRVRSGLGEHREAITLLQAARHAFLSSDMGYDAALVSLELATVFAKEGQPIEVKAIAREILPILQTEEIHREALAALAIFIQAAEAEKVTAELASRISNYLYEARHDPGLRFGGARSGEEGKPHDEKV